MCGKLTAVVAALSFIIFNMLGVVNAAYGMALEHEPVCEWLDTSFNGRQKVKIVRNGKQLQYVDQEEFDVAVLTSLNRWNQQSESDLYFTYEGTTINASSCDGYNRIKIEEVCSSNNKQGVTYGYHRSRCKDRRGKYKSWTITLCNKSQYRKQPEKITGLRVGNVVTGIDLIGALVHELGHSQGLGHPAASLASNPNDYPDAYCDGEAAAMGSTSCSSYTNRMSGRDLYRYDSFCAETGVSGGRRELTVHQLYESGGSISAAFWGGSAVSNLAVWQSNTKTRLEVPRFGVFDWFIFSNISSGNPEKTWAEDHSLHVPMNSSLGLPNSNDEAGALRSALNNYDSNTVWRQKHTAVWNEISELQSAVDPEQVKKCRTSTCVSTEKINSVFPVLLKSAYNSLDRYALWVQMQRATSYGAGKRPYRIRMSELRADDRLSLDLVDLQDSLYTTSQPTFECDPRSYLTSSSFLQFCDLYYVPLEETRGRVHMARLVRDSSSSDFTVLGGGEIPLLDDEDNYITTGGPLVSWRRVGSGNIPTYTYIAFIKNEPGFPIEVVRTTSSNSGVTSMGFWGDGAVNLSVSKNVPAGPVRLMWVQP